jgi:hypothetical protein
MKSNNFTSTVENPTAFTSKNTNTLTTKEAKIAKLPIVPDNFFDKKFLPKPLIKKPIKGKSGTRYINLAMIYFLNDAETKTTTLLWIQALLMF